MAKKSSASSQPERLKSVKSEDIGNRIWSENERQAMLRIAKRQAAGDDSRINFEDIPPLTDEQLAGMVRMPVILRLLLPKSEVCAANGAASAGPALRKVLRFMICLLSAYCIDIRHNGGQWKRKKASASTACSRRCFKKIIQACWTQ